MPVNNSTTRDASLADIIRISNELQSCAIKTGPPWRIVDNAMMQEQYRFPKSKRRRIRAKWSRRDRNYRPMLELAIVMDMVIGHPSVTETLRQTLREKHLTDLDICVMTS